MTGYLQELEEQRILEIEQETYKDNLKAYGTFEDMRHKFKRAENMALYREFHEINFYSKRRTTIEKQEIIDKYNNLLKDYWNARRIKRTKNNILFSAVVEQEKKEIIDKYNNKLLECWKLECLI